MSRDSSAETRSAFSIGSAGAAPALRVRGTALVGQGLARLALLIALLSSLGLLAPSGSRAADGDLDPTFDFDGVARLPFGGPFADLAIQPGDQKIVAVGTSGGNFLIARFNPNGSLDTTFDGDGVVITDFGGNDYANAVHILPTGKIVVAGGRKIFVTFVGDLADFAVAQYNPDGSLDTSFGTGGNGTVVMSLSDASDAANAMAIQPDGKLVLAGYAAVIHPSLSLQRARVAILRLLSDGSADPGFGTNGVVKADPFGCADPFGGGSASEALGVTVQDGNIVASGYAASCGPAPTTYWLVARFLTSGAPDPDFGDPDLAFGDAGIAYLPCLGGLGNTSTGTTFGFHGLAGPHAVSVVGGNKLLLGGSCGARFQLARYESNGLLDGAFGIGGVSTVSLQIFQGSEVESYARDMTIQSDGRVLLGGVYRQDAARWRAGFARFESGGALDTSFGALGRVDANLGTQSAVNAIRIQADGKIVVAGNGGGGEPIVARYFGPPPNMLPVADPGPGHSAPEGSLVTLDGSGSYDPEGQVLTYQWTQTSGPPVTLDLTDPARPTFTAPAVPPDGGFVTFDLTVTDPQGSMDTASIEIAITNVNAPPEANAGPDQVVAEGASIVLDASSSLDQDGDDLSFSWVQTSGQFVVLSGANTALASFTSPQVGVAGAVLRFEVTVSDGLAATADSVEVFVTNVNLGPTANAGPDQAVNEETSVALDGTASGDPDDDALSYEWSQVGGPGAVLSSTTSPSPTFTAPSVPASGATLSFQLVVRDGALPSDPDFVDVTVKNVNHPPVADAGDDQTVAETSPVALDASESYDVDAEALGFSWVQVAGSGVLLSGDTTATPTFAAPLVGPSGETLTFEVTVGDGIDTASDRVAVVVENVNHAPVADAGSDQTVNEGSSVALDGTGSEDPDADSLAYQWGQAGGPAVALSSDTSPSPTFTAPLVSAGDAQLEFELVVNDGLAASEPDQVRVTVQDVNDPPLCDSAEPSQAVLWPPDHKLVEVAITGLSDPDADDLVVTVTGVSQDEAVNGLGDGDSSPDAVISGSGVMVRSERSGLGDGRVYRVAFTASDGAGSCTGSVSVCVPHSRKASCTDSGQYYDSTAP